jgi:hypothetical protein
MYLSAAHLFSQWLRKHDPTATCTVTVLEETLLRITLLAHVRFHGMYECNSHVYLPFSMSAMLNLFDFSEDQAIRDHASNIIDIITQQVFVATSDKGISNLSSSARAFARTRQRVFGHNINQLVRLLVGNSPDPYGTGSITQFLLTTKWKPNYDVVNTYMAPGIFLYTASPSVDGIREFYERCAKDVSSSMPGPKVHLEPDELIPFYWSAGLIVDPMFIKYYIGVKDTKYYIDSRKMRSNIHLGSLDWLSPSIAESLMTSYTHFS